ncbi:TonB-dependent receptor [Maribacter sp. 2308TA10-17]|uniref:TonB-dependent receptor n=1 Tax=Maribacter sp. 2308TA10-17 TaxID=3386276 RepID=UPI0039BC30C3
MQVKLMKIQMIFALFVYHVTFAQTTFEGEVKDEEGEPLVGAHVTLQPNNQFSITDINGVFKVPNITPGTYLVSITHLGSKTYTDSLEIKNDPLSISVIMEDDLLSLQSVVVTGSFEPRTQLESNTAITILNSRALVKTFPRGTADLLQNIPGTFTDPSAGEVFTRVYTRGISASVEDDLGWYYVSLQEDGLPVSLVQHSFYSPDIFHRTDLTTRKVEAIRGGNAAITALNGPGAIFNFISRGPNNNFNGEFSILGGIQGDGNEISKLDGTIGGPLGNDWYFNIGGHYRWDEGARNVNFTFSKGGQLKFNIIKDHDKGYIKFYGKLLDDFTNRYNGVAAVNWDNPSAAFGQNFNTTALLLPKLNTTIPDGRNTLGGASNSFNTSEGLHAQDLAFGIDVFQEFEKEWKLRLNIKYSDKSAEWETSQGNSLISLNNPVAYFASGAELPIGQVVFRDANSKEEVARVNNSGIVMGSSFEYLSDGRLPNDGIMGALPWYKQNETQEWIGQFSVSKELERHDLSFGISGGFSDTSTFTQASFAYVTYEPNPRMLEVTLENPGQPVIDLSDSNGISNYGRLFYGNSRANVEQLATYINDRWNIIDRVHLDIGFRYENIKHQGSNDRFAPLDQSGGLDGNVNTAYDNEIQSSTGMVDNFNFNYDYLSYSFGINYKFFDEAAVFTRFSSANKAPELNYYFNNFSNVPINQEGQVQKIQQAELGFKWNKKRFSSTVTAFWSQLKNVGFIDFEFDPDDGSIFYAPVQFNNSRTIGVELEAAYTPITNLSFLANATIQHAKATKWTVYDAADTVDMSDDSIVDFTGNSLPYNPNLMLNSTVEYDNNKFSAFLKWQFMGEREANVANGFQLPAYSIFNLGLGYKISQKLSANLLVTNIFNSAGLSNFLGVNSIGANVNDVTTQFVTQNPDTSFVVVPVLPRGTILKLNYRF